MSLSQANLFDHSQNRDTKLTIIFDCWLVNKTDDGTFGHWNCISLPCCDKKDFEKLLENMKIQIDSLVLSRKVSNRNQSSFISKEPEKIEVATQIIVKGKLKGKDFAEKTFRSVDSYEQFLKENDLINQNKLTFGYK